MEFFLEIFIQFFLEVCCQIILAGGADTLTWLVGAKAVRTKKEAKQTGQPVKNPWSPAFWIMFPIAVLLTVFVLVNAVLKIRG